MGKQWKQWYTLFSEAPKSLQMVTTAMKLKDAHLLGRKAMTNLDVLKSRDTTLPTKVYRVKSMFFFSSHEWMWGFDHKEGWAPKNWCFHTVVLEKTLENPLDCKEIKPVNPKGNQSSIFIGRTDAEAAIIQLPDVKSRIIGKDHDAGKDWRQEKGTTEDEVAGWHHWLNGHEFEEALGVGDGQGSLHGMQSQTVRHDWATEITELNWWIKPLWTFLYKSFVDVSFNFSWVGNNGV